SVLLKKRGVQHDVLNAKQHEREAEIVAQAGRKGRITISTNMAGRGTDILLGGNPEFLAKRDVGAEPSPNEIEGRLVQERLTKAIQGAQERVEGQNFDIRKNLLEYDDVMNQQRKTIYGMRKEVLAAGAAVPLVWFTEDAKTKKKTRHEKTVTWKDQEEHLYDLIEDLIIEIVDEAVPRGKNDDFDTKALQQRVREQFNVDMSFEGAAHDHEKLQLDIYTVVEKKLKSKFDALGDDFRLYTQWLYLNTIDQLWKDHLLQMDHLRQGIHLRGYGQKDPKIEYKKEGFELFQIMKGRIAASTISMVMRVEPV